MKNSFLGGLAIVAVALALPFLSLHAQEDNSNNPPSNTPPNDGPGSNIPDGLRAQLQSTYRDDLQNVENNRDYRNALIEAHGNMSSSTSAMSPRSGDYGEGSSTMPRPFGGNYYGSDFDEGSSTMPHRPFLPRFASSTAMGSSTGFMPGPEARQDIENHHQELRIRADAFAFIQTNLVGQLNQGLKNLQQIEGRISTKIQGENSQGIDTTNAVNLLTTAQNDIQAATQAIQNLANYVPSTSATSTQETNENQLEASSTIDLSQARELGSTAIKAVEQVRTDLSTVIQALPSNDSSPASTSTEDSNDSSSSTSQTSQ